jgi:transcriptional regulator of acetoin/glycerol metabolism
MHLRRDFVGAVVHDGPPVNFTMAFHDWRRHRIFDACAVTFRFAAATLRATRSDQDHHRRKSGGKRDANSHKPPDLTRDGFCLNFSRVKRVKSQRRNRNAATEAAYRDGKRVAHTANELGIGRGSVYRALEAAGLSAS